MISLVCMGAQRQPADHLAEHIEWHGPEVGIIGSWYCTWVQEAPVVLMSSHSPKSAACMLEYHRGPRGYSEYPHKQYVCLSHRCEAYLEEVYSLLFCRIIVQSVISTCGFLSDVIM